MIPASKAAESMNSLVDVIKSFQGNRPHIGPLHQRRIQGLVDSMPSEFRIVGECMRDGFLRNFESCDKHLDEAVARSWPDVSYELNIATCMLESFRISDCFAYIKSLLVHHLDDTQFLYDACHMMCSVGLYQTAAEICDQLNKLNAEPSDFDSAAHFFSEKYAEFGISDKEVAEYVTKTSLPVKEHLTDKQNLVYDVTVEFFSASYPQTFAFVFHLDEGIENLVDLSESIADLLAENEFSEGVERHLAYSVWAYSEERMKYAS
ncbi:hypothetical protein ACJO5Y_03800 [Marinobacter sp. GN3S48]|uniref:hypothetical protein n=1 Tax=Marinobacter sp. GN3S48 TaxID=3382302 RepID=UPI00387B9418